MARVRLTESRIEREAAKAEIGRRVEIYDELAPGLAVRINRRASNGGGFSASVHFVYVGAIPPSKETVRRSLDKDGRLSLEEAREKARAWRRLIETGKDPAVEEQRQREAEAARRKVTFAVVAEDFIAERLPDQAKEKEVARDIRRDLVSVLGKRPITEIERVDIRAIIKRKRATAPAQARNLLGYASQVFKWALNQEVYGLKANPCADIEAREIIGERATRDRTLSDDEIFAFWRATKREPYPYQQIHQLLLLNALRLNEGAKASGPEFDFRKRDWIIPAARMKGKKSKRRPHLVPLTDASLKIIGMLPELPRGTFLFSCNGGKSGVGVNSDIKTELDAAMLKILRAMARKRGDDPKKVELEPWVNHDLRRTARSTMSGLKNHFGQRIAEEVAESVIAHVRPGIKGVYDKYAYADEKFEALELWARYVEAIVEPKQVEDAERKIIPYPVRQHA